MRSQLRKSFDHCETGRDKPLGVLLLGMHHSGTSTMAGLLIRSGLYGGKSGELLFTPCEISDEDLEPTGVVEEAREGVAV